MRILILAHAFNSLTQRLFVELRDAGHDVAVELDVNDRVSEEAVELHRPDLIVAPFLKRAIPGSIWRSHRCIVIHPGIKGDRGPSALDWAILDRETTWGVTALQANGEMDAGDVWASVDFPMRDATKSSLYRNEVTEAAVGALRLAMERMAIPGFRPEPLDYSHVDVRGRLRPAMRQADRAIDWAQRRHHDDSSAPPGFRRFAGRSGRGRGRAVPPIWRASGGQATGHCRSSHRAARRRDLSRDGRWRHLDQPCQARGPGTGVEASCRDDPWRHCGQRSRIAARS